LDAVGQARPNCWDYDWVLDLDVRGFFDNLDWELLMKAVKKHPQERWVVLYIERWLKTPAQEEDGTLVERTSGTPQGGVIQSAVSESISALWCARTNLVLPAGEIPAPTRGAAASPGIESWV
jgi:RNA-directed DNA polymerase